MGTKRKAVISVETDDVLSNDMVDSSHFGLLDEGENTSETYKGVQTCPHMLYTHGL